MFIPKLPTDTSAFHTPGTHAAYGAPMQRPDPLELNAMLAAAHQLQPTGSHRRELLVQNGLLAVERVRDPLVSDAIVVSIGERARVMARAEFRSWLDAVRRAVDTC
jgi:hypothetical protein